MIVFSLAISRSVHVTRRVCVSFERLLASPHIGTAARVTCSTAVRNERHENRVSGVPIDLPMRQGFRKQISVCLEVYARTNLAFFNIFFFSTRDSQKSTLVYLQESNLFGSSLWNVGELK